MVAVVVEEEEEVVEVVERRGRIAVCGAVVYRLSQKTRWVG